MSLVKGCISCDYLSGTRAVSVVYENELLFCPLANDPISRGHVLVVPKKHVSDLDDLDDVTRSSIVEVTSLLVRAVKQAFAPDGYTIMQNGGAFNDTGHLHVHIFPRYHGDGFGWQYDEFAVDAEYFAEYRERLIRELRNVPHRE